MFAPEYSCVIFSVQVLESVIYAKMLTFKRTSFKYFANILVKISLNHNSFIIYIERAVEKCQKLTFLGLWWPRNE